ncbi:MAG: hypothetical protein ACREJU_05150 [Nitrospiraceae bacterium]
MMRRIKSAIDLAWFLRHTQAFQGGHVTDLHVHKQHLLDESSGHEVAAGTILTVTIRYEPSIRESEGSYTISRVAKLTMKGVTDFSVFEQEGADFSEISVIHADVSGGRLRFWFDPQGELYVICDEAEIEEVSTPATAKPIRAGMAEWTFQAEVGKAPSIKWFLDHLDRAGVPCAWRSLKSPISTHPAMRWTGHLLPASVHDGPRPAGVQVQAYGPFDGSAFGITLRASDPHNDQTGRLLVILADLIARSFEGMCLARNHIMERGEWLAR